MFAKLEQIRANDRILYTLVLVALFEIYFLYSGISGSIQNEIQNPQYLWLRLISKVLLGFLVYKLYTAGNKKLAVSGAFLTVAILATIYVVYVVSPDRESPILGGFFFFVISVNTFFLIRYLRHPEFIFQPTMIPDKFYLKPAFMALSHAVVLVWVSISPDGIMQWIILLGWISLYLATEGVWAPKQK